MKYFEREKYILFLKVVFQRDSESFINKLLQNNVVSPKIIVIYLHKEYSHKEKLYSNNRKCMRIFLQIKVYFPFYLHHV